MVNKKTGDFDSADNITNADVEYFLNGMKNGIFLDHSSPDFEISNIMRKQPFQGPNFHEVLYLRKVIDDSKALPEEIDPELEDAEFAIKIQENESIVHFGQKGASVDTYKNKIVASFPKAKVSNYFHEHGNTETPVDKNIGFAKVYSFADEQDYSDYDMLLPPVFASRDGDTVPHDIEFGKQSIKIHGDYVAVSAFYSRPKTTSDTDPSPLPKQPKTAKIFVYKKHDEVTQSADTGYKFYCAIEDLDFAVEPTLELTDEHLFASDYVNNFVKVYKVADLENLSAFEQATPISTIRPLSQIKPTGDDTYNTEWGKRIVCRDGENLFIGVPNGIVKYSLAVATGYIEHWVLDKTVSNDDTQGAGNSNSPWVLSSSVKPSENDLPWWTKWSEWSDTLCGVSAKVAETSYNQGVEGDSVESLQVNAACYVRGKYTEEDDGIPLEARGDWWCNVWQSEKEISEKTWTEEATSSLQAWWTGVAVQSSYPTTLLANERANELGVFFNEDLQGYYEQGSQGPNPIDSSGVPTFMYFTSDFRFGESFDYRGMGASASKPSNFSKTELYLVVGCPRWAEDSDPENTAEIERTGATFVFDVRPTKDSISGKITENAGTISKIKRIIPSSTPAVRAMNVEDEEETYRGEHFISEDISAHFQAESPIQSELVNRGWPGSWSTEPSFTATNVTFNWESNLLHSAPHEKGTMVFGEVESGEFETWTKDYPEGDESTFSTKAGEALGYIKMNENPLYSMNDDDLTIEFWWKPTHSYTNELTSETLTPTIFTASKSAPIMSYQAETSKNDMEWWDLRYDANLSKLQLRYPSDKTSSRFYRYSSAENSINVDTWHHIALVHQKNDEFTTESNSKFKKLQLYINGTAQFIINSNGFTESDVGSSRLLGFDDKVKELDSDAENSQHLYIGASPGGLGENIGSADTGGFEGFGNHCFDDIRITHGARYTKDFTKSISAFDVDHFPMGFGADVAMDADYDIYILNNKSGGTIEKYNNDRYNFSKEESLTAIDWSRDDKVSLAKDNPVVGGEISIYDKDLVYGNLNDLRIYPRTVDMSISDGNTENLQLGGEAFQYTLAPIQSEYTYTVELRGYGTITWPDGTTQQYDSRSGYTKISKQFDKIDDGTHVSITGLTGFGESSGADEGQAKIIDVGESIPSTLIEFKNSFKGCANFDSDNITKWNTQYVKSMMGMFSGATSFNGDISDWNTESLENASYMFKNATSFNANLTNWFTANVKNMTSMFQGATSFNQPIDVWDVRNVENMNNMFNGASVFNQDLSMWCSSTISDTPENFAPSTPLQSNQLPDWNRNCQHGFVEFTFDVSEINGQFTAVLPFQRNQQYHALRNDPFDTRNAIARQEDEVAMRTYAGEYDWYVDWGHASGNIRDTEEPYEGGKINEKWSVPGPLFGLTPEILNEKNVDQNADANNYAVEWNNAKDHVLYHIYPNVSALSEIKVRVYTSDINFSDEYFNGFEYYGASKDTPENWWKLHEEYEGPYNTTQKYREDENQSASTLYELLVGTTNNNMSGIFCKNLKKVLVNNVQLKNLIIDKLQRNDDVFDESKVGALFYVNETFELEELDIRGLKWFNEYIPTGFFKIKNFDTIKLDWPIQNPIRLPNIELWGVNQTYPNFPLYDTIGRYIRFREWNDLNFDLIKPQYNRFISRVTPPDGSSNLELSFLSINTISEELKSIRVKFDNKEAYDLSRTEHELLEIQEGDIFIKNNYVSNDLSPISNLSTFNTESTNISYSDLENKVINFSDSDGFYVDIEVRENGKYYGDFDISESLKSNISYNFEFQHSNVNQLLINDINVYSVRLDYSDIKNLDDVCRKIHPGNDGMIIRSCFAYNKFEGILDISHWSLKNWKNAVETNYNNVSLSHTFENFKPEKIILPPNFDLMVTAVDDFTYCWREAENIPDIRNWRIANSGRSINLKYMFSKTDLGKFNQNINTKTVEKHGLTYKAWDVSNVTNMQGMFQQTTFKRDLSSWDVSKVTNFLYMFNESNFNGNITTWDVSSANDMRYMFDEATNFDQDLSSWCVHTISTKPDSFDSNSPLADNASHHPKWGEECDGDE